MDEVNGECGKGVSVFFNKASAGPYQGQESLSNTGKALVEAEQQLEVRFENHISCQGGEQDG